MDRRLRHRGHVHRSRCAQRRRGVPGGEGAVDAAGLRPGRDRGRPELGIPSGDIRRLFHGTTVTTNAVITKRGAATGLITTEGFRDILEIRRANREELYDILWDPPPALVPRRHRLEVAERVAYDGTVVTPLDEDTVRDAIRRIRARGLESVAVCLINAHMNPAHERRIRDLLLEADPELSVSLSTEILPEPPEFERTATTVANAYTAPILSRYMTTLVESLREDGFNEDIVLVMHNGGGTMTSDYAKGHAVKTLNSGPAAGVIAGAAIAESAGVANAVCIDMGGTTCEFAVVVDGKPQMSTSFDLEWGMPIRFPSIDVMSIGAGGGSIGWLDPAGKPRNGPQSAGADPGPACYGQGGTEPTNTDAHLVLGRVSNDEFLDGRMALDRELATDAVRQGLAEPLGLSIDDAAEGLLRIANANMVAAIRLITVERGYDPRDFTLIAFGGAGPLHAVDIARELEMPEVIVPAYPGVTSALGLLFVDPLDDFSLGLRAPSGRARRPGGRLDLRRDRRPRPHEPGAAGRRARAARAGAQPRPALHRPAALDHRAAGGRDRRRIRPCDRALPRRARAALPLQPPRAARGVVDAPRDGARCARTPRPRRGPLRRRTASSARRRRARSTSRTPAGSTRGSSTAAALAPDAELVGPCIVEGVDTTVVLPPGIAARVDAAGDIVIAVRA